MLDGAYGDLWLATSMGFITRNGASRANSRPQDCQPLSRRSLWTRPVAFGQVCRAALRCAGLRSASHSDCRELGLAARNVSALAADATGAMWIGTDAGLLRYDGTRMSIYSSARGAAFERGAVAGMRSGRRGVGGHGCRHCSRLRWKDRSIYAEGRILEQCGALDSRGSRGESLAGNGVRGRGYFARSRIYHVYGAGRDLG